MPNKVKSIILSILFVIIAISLSRIAMQGYYPTIYILFLIMSIFIFLSKWENIVLLFIIMYPMQDVLPSKSLMIPGLGIVEILLIILIVKYFMTYNRLKLNFNRIQKLAVLLSFFFIVIYTGTSYIKHYMFFGMAQYSDAKLIVRLFKLFLLFFSILLIISKSKEPLVFSIIQKGLFFGFILYGFSVLFSNYFISLGLNVSSEFKYETGAVSQGIMRDRAVGLLQGDSGLLAHYLCVGLGFFLAFIERSKEKLFICLFGIISVILGVLITASRAGLVVCGVILFMYLLKNIKFKNSFIAVAVLIGVFGLVKYFGGYTLERIFEVPEELVQYQYSGRKYFQTFYINEIAENPIYLITGYLEPSKLYTDYNRIRSPHNQYLGMVFWGGLPFLFIFLGLLYKIYKCNKIKYNSLDSFVILYPFIGFSLSYLFNPNEFIVYFPLVLSISPGIITKYSKFIDPSKKQFFNTI